MARSIKTAFGGGAATHDFGRIVVPGKTYDDLEREALLVRDYANLGRSTLQKFSSALCKEVGIIDPIIMGPTKEIHRIIQKAVARYEGDVRRVKDPARDTIPMDGPWHYVAIKGLLGSKTFRETQEARGVKILSAEDWMGIPKPTGWRGIVIHLEVDVGKGRKTNAEVQIVPKDMMQAYERTHTYQEQIRQLEDLAKAEGRPLSRHEQNTIDGHRFATRSIHSETFQRSPFRIYDKSGYDSDKRALKII